MSDAAAVAGVDMNEMGAIFNKVAANGKVTTEEMNQLADRGIPIWQLLAKETGMSMDELRNAVSSGKIDINDFQNAIETGMGGAAKTIGSTTIKGAIANIGASLSRMGANFLGSADNANSFAGKLLPLFNNLMGFMSKIESGASVLGSVIGSILGPIMDGLGQVFDEVGKGSGTLAPLKDVLLQIGNILGTVIASVFPIIISGIKSTFTIINALMPVVSSIISHVMPVAQVVISVVKTVAQAMSRLNTSVSKAVASIISKLSFSGIVANVKGVWTKVKTAITQPIDAAKNKLTSIVNKIKKLFPLKVGKIFSNLKIPRISISGGKAPFGIGGLGSKPHISVSWHKKAMENPYLFSNATLFGAGEAGDEILYGRKSLLRDIKEATQGGNTFNVTLNANGTENPEQYAQRFARELHRQVRMGAI
jgi:tape measure domain-containing protein